MQKWVEVGLGENRRAIHFRDTQNYGFNTNIFLTLSNKVNKYLWLWLVCLFVCFLFLENALWKPWNWDRLYSYLLYWKRCIQEQWFARRKMWNYFNTLRFMKKITARIQYCITCDKGITFYSKIYKHIFFF